MGNPDFADFPFEHKIPKRSSCSDLLNGNPRRRRIFYLAKSLFGLCFFEENPDLDFKIAPIQNAPLNWSFYIYRKVVEPQQTLAGTKRLFLIFQFLLSS